MQADQIFEVTSFLKPFFLFDFCQVMHRNYKETIEPRGGTLGVIWEAREAPPGKNLMKESLPTQLEFIIHTFPFDIVALSWQIFLTLRKRNARKNTHPLLYTISKTC